MGLTSDSLIGARVVTADGAVVDTDEDPSCCGRCAAAAEISAC
jgi:hypothetical protein